jgi:hypothetical protein
MAQIIRYTDSPVGPYDELVLVPGKFEYEHGGKRSNAKVSRIYVSQEKACYNGRKSEWKDFMFHFPCSFTEGHSDWSIPKHLASFSFTPLPSGGVEILVFPHDTTSDITEFRPSSRPFFKGIYKPISYIPSFPSSTTMAKYIGMDMHIVQPQLPEGKGSLGELTGTDRWCKVLPLEYNKKTSLGWWDLRQDGRNGAEVTEQDSLLVNSDSEDSEERAGSNFENWWPGFGRWRIGLKMEDATIYFDEGEHWS